MILLNYFEMRTYMNWIFKHRDAPFWACLVWLTLDVIELMFLIGGRSRFRTKRDGDLYHTFFGSLGNSALCSQRLMNITNVLHVENNLSRRKLSPGRIQDYSRNYLLILLCSRHHISFHQVMQQLKIHKDVVSPWACLFAVLKLHQALWVVWVQTTSAR